MYKSVSRRRKEKKRLRRDACSLCALCANPVFLILRHANLKVGVPKRIAPLRREEALTPRWPHRRVNCRLLGVCYNRYRLYVAREDADMQITVVNRALSLFSEGYSCSQSVALAFLENSLPPSVVAALSASFGGGMGRSGQTCGAISGAVMVIGYYYGQRVPFEAEKKERAYGLVQQWVKAFNAEFGHTTCNGLIGVDVADENQRARAREQGLFDARCPRFVQRAAELTHQLLIKHPIAYPR